jgi:hypothetical protein
MCLVPVAPVIRGHLRLFEPVVDMFTAYNFTPIHAHLTSFQYKYNIIMRHLKSSIAFTSSLNMPVAAVQATPARVFQEN